MIHYLIDSENVSLKNILIPDDSHGILFVNKTLLKKAKELCKEKPNLEYIFCQNGEKDALDIQLSFYLGNNLNKEDTYVIVSRDKGYDSMISYAYNEGYRIFRNLAPVREHSKKETKEYAFWLKCHDYNMHDIYSYLMAKRNPSYKNLLTYSKHPKKKAVKECVLLAKKKDVKASKDVLYSFFIHQKDVSRLRDDFRETFGEEEFLKIENFFKLFTMVLTD